MLLSQLIENMQGLMVEHGDHEVWYQEHEGDAIPYNAEWFMFEPDGFWDSPENVYVV